MAFKRRKASKIIAEAKVRLSAMEQIDTDQGAVIDYGGPARSITAAIFKSAIAAAELKISDYDKLLEKADEAGNIINAVEKEIQKMYTAVLKSASGKFDEDGNEIEMLGGTRKSERKRRKPKPKA